MRVKRSDLIELSPEELTRLIDESNGRRVHATFPGGALILGEGTRWCLPIIADMRGVAMSQELRNSFKAR